MMSDAKKQFNAMKSREKELLFLYLFFDLAILNSTIVLTSFLSFGITTWDFKQVSVYLLHANLSWITTYFIFSKKNLLVRDSNFDKIWRISKRMFAFILVSAAIASVIMPKTASRSFVVEYIAVFYFTLLLFYFVLYKIVKFRRDNKKNIDNCLIIDSNETGEMLRRVIENNPILGCHFEGFLCDLCPDKESVIGGSDDLLETIDKHNIQVVFVVLSLFNKSDKAREYLKICNQKGVRMFFVPENQRWFVNKFNTESLGGILIISPQSFPLDEIGLRIQKRVFDIAFSLAVIIFVFSWLFPILAILIRYYSKGPVFFVQKRTGINNKSFDCIKFRSMRVNSQSDELQASANDTRITKIGNFMRKTNIDELPQFLNVFMGQMSVVGPRPHMLKHTEEYSKLIDDYLVRHYVKPGITGWAQVNGYRGETDELWKMEKRVEYDMEYIENWTFIWDIKIIWLTIFGKNVFKNAV